MPVGRGAHMKAQRRAKRKRASQEAKLIWSQTASKPPTMRTAATKKQ